MNRERVRRRLETIGDYRRDTYGVKCHDVPLLLCQTPSKNGSDNPTLLVERQVRSHFKYLTD